MMLADRPLDLRRPARVMVDTPATDARAVLRGTFRVMEDVPEDIARVLERLRQVN